MKNLLSILGVLFLMNINYGYGQDSGLLLKITRVHEGMEWCPGGVDSNGHATPVTDKNEFEKTLGNTTRVRRYKPPITDKDLVLRCELTNISNKEITIERFLSFSTRGNTIQVESPNGKISNLGFSCSEPPPPGIIIAPQKTVCWNADMRTWYFFSKSSKETGIYKFYWVINEIRSEAFVYEHVRKD